MLHLSFGVKTIRTKNLKERERETKERLMNKKTDLWSESKEIDTSTDPLCFCSQNPSRVSEIFPFLYI
jgi:hypothetical protein